MIYRQYLDKKLHKRNYIGDKHDRYFNKWYLKENIRYGSECNCDRTFYVGGIYFDEAAGASAIFSVITAYMLKSWVPLISSGLTLAYYKKLYADALSRTPTQNPTEVLIPPQLTINDNGIYEPMTTEQLNRIRKFIDSKI